MIWNVAAEYWTSMSGKKSQTRASHQAGGGKCHFREALWKVKVFWKLSCTELFSLFIPFLPEYRNVKFAFRRACVMNSAVQTLGTVNDWSSYTDLLILGCCSVSLDLYLKSRRELLSQNCRFQRVSAEPWGKQICSFFFAPFTRWELLGERPLCFQLWKIPGEGKLKQEAIPEAKPGSISDLTKELFADGCQ